jgi:wyosine [tRNA(Phe)-imidazoG37] synthetase (radical SAM superfamily)
MRYVFGPVPSRRLGRSLGIDPVPMKTCNWNCVYCQLGGTRDPGASPESLPSVDDVVEEVRAALAAPGAGAIDWVTFAGSGEPTLHPELGRMIRGVKCLASVPVAVITNGALLYRPEVRAGLSESDAVLPTLDAGTDRLYRRINRPDSSLDFERYVAGLETFRREFGGQMWLEVMLIRGLNDGEEVLRDLAAVIRRIGPDQVNINQPTRPPSEPWVEPPDEEGLERAKRLLGDSARMVAPSGGAVELIGGGDLAEAIEGLVSRHPIEEGELLQSLAGRSEEEIRRALADLEASGRARALERRGVRHWVSAEARFVEQGAQRKHTRGAHG